MPRAHNLKAYGTIPHAAAITVEATNAADIDHAAVGCQKLK